MNKDEKKENLNYDFDFEKQVVKPENKVLDDVEVLNDSEVDELEELEEMKEPEINIEELKESNSEKNENETIVEETKEENVKKVKILNKEFNLEDIILLLIGLIIVLAIFLLPRIMKIFG